MYCHPKDRLVFKVGNMTKRWLQQKNIYSYIYTVSFSVENKVAYALLDQYNVRINGFENSKTNFVLYLLHSQFPHIFYLIFLFSETTTLTFHLENSFL